MEKLTNDTPGAALDGLISSLMTEAGITAQRGLIRRILSTGIGLGQDGADRLNLKITAAALEEMQEAFRLFAPHGEIPKVSIFGSARIAANDPLWMSAEATARGLAEQGWFVVTGAGPGIMEAAATGAGSERALGVSIRLPFEEQPNEVLTESDRLVSMKYFFTRKLMLVKESSGFVCLPGGFGTLDETLELFTLQQTGKMIPAPIVLLDRPGGSYWRGFAEFVTKELAGSGMISIGDLDRVLVTDSVDEAIAEITGFWRNYVSLRWVGEQLVLRLRTVPSDAQLADLNERFSGLCREGEIERTEPLEVERDERDLLGLPRVVFTPHPRAVSELYRLIRVLNRFA